MLLTSNWLIKISAGLVAHNRLKYLWSISSCLRCLCKNDINTCKICCIPHPPKCNQWKTSGCWTWKQKAKISPHTQLFPISYAHTVPSLGNHISRTLLVTVWQHDIAWHNFHFFAPLLKKLSMFSMVVSNVLALISCKAKWLEFYLLGSFLLSCFNQIKGTNVAKKPLT